MILYLIKNKTTGKEYVGITSKTLPVRWSQHKWSSENGSEYHLHRAMRKYGVDDFEISAIASASDFESLNKLESVEIERRSTKSPHGYNMTNGGDGIRGFQHSDETRAKIRSAHSGKTLSDSHKAALLKAITGRKMNDAHRLALSSRVVTDEEREARRERAMGNTWAKGAVRTEAQKDAVRKSSTGRVFSEESREKIRAARAIQEPTFGMLGKSHSDETKAKMRSAKLGKKKSPETIERMKIAAKKRCEAKRASG